MEFIVNKYGEHFIYNEEVPPVNMSTMFPQVYKWISLNMSRWQVGEGQYIKF